ncbi:unnamed protein product [Polarella glacialis]|uniref:Uncharacterized protein n=1 Tax=Polarella glacialis TaxID=89957 RepID=A0A813JVC4_POLGL|nr:unnamed protein product [Polarella glacialis]
MGLLLQVLLAWNLVALSLGDFHVCLARLMEMSMNCSSYNDMARDSQGGNYYGSISVPALKKDFCDAGACRSAAMEADVACKDAGVNSTFPSLLSPYASPVFKVNYYHPQSSGTGTALQ